MQPPQHRIPIICDGNSSQIPMSLIQVSPIILQGSSTSSYYCSTINEELSAPVVKLYLKEVCQERLRVLWNTPNEKSKRHIGKNLTQTIQKGFIYSNHAEFIERINQVNIELQSEENTKGSLPVLYLPSSNPLNAEGIPCILKTYTVPIVIKGGIHLQQDSLYISDATLVQIAAPILASRIDSVSTKLGIATVVKDCAYFPPSFIKNELSGEYDVRKKYLDPNILLYYEKETVNELTIRMQMLLDQQVIVGTTSSSLSLWDQEKQRHLRIKSVLGKLNMDQDCNEKQDGLNLDMENMSLDNSHEFISEGALTVHNPIKAFGKTTLVASIATQTLKCDAVHIIHAPFLFSKYGASGADAALESLLHSLVVSAAIKGMAKDEIGSICIILDNLECFVPPTMGGGKNDGDPAIPTLNAIHAYLSKLVNMLKNNTFPFPTKNPLYNINDTTNHGCVIPVKVCLVGVITCEDDGGKKGAGNELMGTVLETLGESRCRVRSPNVEGSYKICCQLFQQYNIDLTQEARDELPFTLSLLQNPKISTYETIVRKSLQLKSETSSVITLHQLKDIVSSSKRDKSSILSSSREKPSTSRNVFASVGGNTDAKKALLDALALDRQKRRILERFGLSPPNGVLLFGPPGTGKTLLAKATAQLMQADSTNDEGVGKIGKGLFLSLSASDIVRAEVGKSEKLVTNAFQSAMENAPSVIFIDEFQALFTSRDGGSGSSRLASTLLQCMDDIAKWTSVDKSIAKNQNSHFDLNSNRVVVLAATNTPWMVDKAFLRTGRFDRVVHVGLPNETERQSILKVHIERMKLHESTSIEEICSTLVPLTIGFSGADIAALTRSAAVQCLNDRNADNALGVQSKHFQAARQFDVTEPSSNKELVSRLQKWKS